MNKIKTFIWFLILLGLWSLFFASLKLFLWWSLQGSLNLDLQIIAWYLSLGWVFAYLIGWALSYTFLKKYLLFGIALSTLVFITIGYLIGFHTHLFFAFILCMVGFFYGLWSVVKNILIAIEIKKTWFLDTTVNALAVIVFVVFIIIWSILWGLLFELFGNAGYIYIMWLISIISFCSLFLDYDEVPFRSLFKQWYRAYFYDKSHKFSDAMKGYLPDVLYIHKKFTWVLYVSAFLWAISTIISQKAIEYSVLFLWIEISVASTILIFSAAWVITGNIISLKMHAYRWKFFMFSCILFGILIILFPFLGNTFFHLQILASLLWLFFWISANLIDAYFFWEIGNEDKKEYGSSVYGFILSIVIFVMMFISSFMEKIIWYTWLCVMLWLLVIGMGFLFIAKD